MDLFAVFKQNDWVLILTFIALLVMSVLSWVTAIIQFIRFSRAKKADQIFLKDYLELLNSESILNTEYHSSLFSIVKEAIQSKQKYNDQYSHVKHKLPLDEYITRSIKHSISQIMRPFSSGLTLLASIGSTAPFIGLFGTVWGIYHALINISNAGQVSISEVSGPIGEALVATAAGLFVAIPAVLFYNTLIRLNKNRSAYTDSFAYDLRAHLMSEDRS